MSIGNSRVSEEYFSGKFRLEWLRKAALLPGKSFVVSVLLLHGASLNRSDTIKITPTFLRKLGINGKTFGRSLVRLEGVGLISFVDKSRGRSPTVKLHDYKLAHEGQKTKFQGGGFDG